MIERDRKVKELAEQGMTCKEIASAMNLNTETTRGICRKHGIKYKAGLSGRQPGQYDKKKRVRGPNKTRKGVPIQPPPQPQPMMPSVVIYPQQSYQYQPVMQTPPPLPTKPPPVTGGNIIVEPENTNNELKMLLEKITKL